MNLIDFLPSDRIRFDQKSTSWKAAVKSVGQILLEADLIEKKYISKMVKTVEELGPYIVITPGVAIAHARPEDGVKMPGLACLKTKNPIYFGNKENDPVYIVFGLAAKDHEQHVEALREIAEILMNEEKREKLFLAKNETQISEVLYY